jgi:hypothetical protein
MNYKLLTPLEIPEVQEATAPSAGFVKLGILDKKLTLSFSDSTVKQLDTNLVTSVAGKIGVVTLDKSDVGLSNVDNTSDTNKPISTATQEALNSKITSNPAIAAGTFSKITYDSKGLILSGQSLSASDIPTLNQNTTGTSSNVTGIISILNGGTGATTSSQALSNLGAYPASNPSGYTSNTGTVISVNATSPLVSSGGTTPSLSIPAATSSLNGYMSASDKTKLDGIAVGATNVTNTDQLINGAGFTANTGTVTSVGGTGTISGLTLSGNVTTSGNLTLGGTLSLTSGQVTTALGYTPYNSTNPSGYITSSSSISGNAGTATTLQTARTLTVGNTGKTFNGSANVDWTLAEIGAYAATNPSGYTTNTGTVTSVGGTGGYGGLTLSGIVTTSGNLTLGGTPTGTWPISVSGNAATATALQTARTINGVSFDGTANITISTASANALTIGTGLTGTSYNGSSAVTVAIDSSVTTLIGTQTLSNKTITGLKETSFDVADSTINLNSGNYFTKTVTSNVNFIVTNVPSAPTVASFILELKFGGSALITWWSNITWANGIAPTLTASGDDILGFYTLDGGETWRGMLLATDIKAV